MSFDNKTTSKVKLAWEEEIGVELSDDYRDGVIDRRNSYLNKVCIHCNCLLDSWMDVFLFIYQAKAEEEEVDHTPWGELEPSDEESSEEEEEEESDEEKPDETGFFTPADRYHDAKYS